jgi:hypothetical protein
MGVSKSAGIMAAGALRRARERKAKSEAEGGVGSGRRGWKRKARLELEGFEPPEGGKRKRFIKIQRSLLLQAAE